MDSIATNIAVNREASVCVTHEFHNELTSTERAACVVESNDLNNVLSTVDCWIGELRRRVYVFWSNSSSSEFSAVFIPERSRLFVGGGTVSAVVDTDVLQLVEYHAPMLFWAFKRHGPYVVEYGELECVLYDEYGVILDNAGVDPPYETLILETGINFQSICAGSTWLKFPE